MVNTRIYDIVKRSKVLTRTEIDHFPLACELDCKFMPYSSEESVLSDMNFTSYKCCASKESDFQEKLNDEYTFEKLDCKFMPHSSEESVLSDMNFTSYKCCASKESDFQEKLNDEYTFEKLDNISSLLMTIMSQPSKYLKFTTFREVCFVIHVAYKYLSKTLEAFFNHQFYKR